MPRREAPQPVGVRAPLVLLAVAAVALVPTMVVARDEPPPDWELDLTEWINGAPDWLAVVLWPIMQLGTFWSPIVVGLAAGWWFGWRRGVAVLASGIVAWLLAKLIKEIFDRGRPLAYLPDIDVREGSGTGLGYVSGHTAVAFAVATAVMWVLPRWARVVAYVLATLVGIARIVYGMHFPMDVAGGACVGIMSACAVEIVLRITRVRSAAHA